MERIGDVPKIAILAAMLVSVTGQPPTRSFSPDVTTLAGIILPKECTDRWCSSYTQLVKR